MTDLNYAGYKINLSDHLSKRTQKRFPRSKKNRIRRKWAKRDKNYVSVPDMQIYVMEEAKTIAMHPAVWAKIEKELADYSTPDIITWPKPVHTPFVHFPMMPFPSPKLSMFGRLVF